TGPILVDGSSHLAIVTTLTNIGGETLEVLNDPETVLSSLATDSFVIKDGKGTSPEFVGYVVSRVPSEAGQKDGFSSLKPGDSVKITHHRKIWRKLTYLFLLQVGQAYSFRGTGVGVYTIRARTTFRYRNGDTGDLIPIEADTEDHIVSVLLHNGDPFNDTNLNFERRATVTDAP
ncbi:hypothetical protein M413DRAFT_68430, partial [Hebeloma cylindrosporum]